MDASHIMVGGLTAVTLALLVWIEIRSRRGTAEKATQSVSRADARPEKHES